MSRNIIFSVVEGDVITYPADVLALKYARGWHGADRSIARELAKNGLLSLDDYRLDIGKHAFVDTRSSIVASSQVLLIGVPRLQLFRYDEINQFAADALRITAEQTPHITHLAMTLHGVGYGLDENAALISQITGLLKGLSAGQYPSKLEKITVVERDSERLARLRTSLSPELAARGIELLRSEAWSYQFPAATPISMDRVERAVPASEVPLDTDIQSVGKQHHAFVAMPFKSDMDDIFFYGIQQPVHRVGLLCERADFDSFTGDVMDYVKERIETASVVIADLTGANANVYLEVGYSWGRERPTILIVSDPQELKFDVRGQRCLVYPSIRKLEEMLEKELRTLIAKGIVEV